MIQRSMVRRAAVLLLCVPLLSGCAILSGVFRADDPAPDPSEGVYRAAMADFSACATATDPVIRAAMAERLAGAAARMQAEIRPANPDHFYMTDRVSAAAAYCAGAAR